MADDFLRYEEMVEMALRDVVRRSLALVAERGLPGAHHFYITFRTDRPDVLIPTRLRQQYPKEMTIVVQHQFWGLEVDRDTLRITLSFNNQQERLVIPFTALTAFADPSCKFGLQFEARSGAASELPAERNLPAPARAGVPAAAPAPAAPADAKGAEVVTLDAFRKK
ncbi:MAG TPA: ClpXP protease specificity-enhancing factor SspB [Hypericibacter adhaerens]|jgi:hypothetical protein|nr:ClpXP protease specificity-enhancing factor SspB [Hypericibacter adhaerens]HWA45497.1 ClpXP protease specificity-enhancing factor SspB [Hypericibacter adhaerens]